MLLAPPFRVDLQSGVLSGEHLIHSVRRLGALGGCFEEESVRAAMDQDRVVYRVSALMPVKDGTPGGLFFGTSFVEPGRVGAEYFMTKGHFHQQRDSAEYYWGIQGEGVLILMDEQRRCWGETVSPGSLHYIPGRVAHRLANTGEVTLVVGACWPADAGHDYASIAEQGFSARLKCVSGKPALIPQECDEPSP